MAAKKKSQLKLGPLGREFQNMLDQLEARIAQKGLNMTVVCTEAGIARANPVRWRQRLPNTIVLMDRLLEAVEKLPAQP